jgi:hypothetical protein
VASLHPLVDCGAWCPQRLFTLVLDKSTSLMRTVYTGVEVGMDFVSPIV